MSDYTTARAAINTSGLGLSYVRDGRAALGRLRGDIAQLGGMILEYHDRSHGSSVDVCAATLCRDYVAFRNERMAETNERITT